MRPKVSVLVPTHQRPALLRDALRSIHGQTMPRDRYEVIVANDDTVPLADDVMDGLNGRVLQGPFGGCGAALAAALKCAQGDYCTIAADDDLMLPDKLRCLSDALDQCGPEIVAVYGLPIYTTMAGGRMGCPPFMMAWQMMHPVVRFEHAVSGGLWAHGTALLYRTDAVKRVGGFDPTMPTAEEYDMHLRLLRFAGDFKAVDAEVVTYRLGGKHRQYKNGRPREHMRRMWAKVATPTEPVLKQVA